MTGTRTADLLLRFEEAGGVVDGVLREGIGREGVVEDLRRQRRRPGDGEQEETKTRAAASRAPVRRRRTVTAQPVPRFPAAALARRARTR